MVTGIADDVVCAGEGYIVVVRCCSSLMRDSSDVENLLGGPAIVSF